MTAGDVRVFAKEIVQSVRDHMHAHDRDTLQLSVWIANSPNPQCVLDLLPVLLSNDVYMVIDIMEDAVNDIPAFKDVKLKHVVQFVRANRG